MKNKWNWVVVIFVLTGAWLVWMGQQRSAERSKTVHDTTIINQFYDIATNCQTAKSPPRPPDYTKDCYDRAQEISGYNGERFGDAK